MWLNRERGVAELQDVVVIFIKLKMLKNIELSGVPAPYPDFFKINCNEIRTRNSWKN
jgi:hypothetical protein